MVGAVLTSRQKMEPTLHLNRPRPEIGILTGDMAYPDQLLVVIAIIAIPASMLPALSKSKYAGMRTPV
jgi:hypothetical protein